MRRPFLVAIATLSLIAALLQTQQGFSAMNTKPTALGRNDDASLSSYHSAQKRGSEQSDTNSRVGLASRAFVVSTSYLLIQSDQQPVAEDEENSSISMWAIVLIVLVVLFLIVVVIAVGVTLLLIARKRGKTKSVAGVSAGGAVGPGAARPTPSYDAPAPAAISERAAPAEASAPASDAGKEQYPPSAPEVFTEGDRSATIDLSRTIAIPPQVDTAPMSYGSITFVSGALNGQTFEIKAEGANIGRDASTSQIVIADPRISKRHVWIGVRDGHVTIEDLASRNGTFLNDPKSARLTEGVLKDGDTVILGESDVARFEYRK